MESFVLCLPRFLPALHAAQTRVPSFFSRVSLISLKWCKTQLSRSHTHTKSFPLERLEPHYGVVPKGLLTFLGSLYKEGAKTTSGTLVYIASRDKPPEKNSSFQKQCVLNLECRFLAQEPSDTCILYFNVIFHEKFAEEDTNRPLATSEYRENLFP